MPGSSAVRRKARDAVTQRLESDGPVLGEGTDDAAGGEPELEEGAELAVVGNNDANGLQLEDDKEFGCWLSM